MPQKLYRGEGMITRVATNRGGDAYALINAKGGRTVYLDLALMTTWPAFRPGMVLDPIEGEWIEFSCRVEGKQVFVVQVLDYQPLEQVEHEGELTCRVERYQLQPEPRGSRGRFDAPTRPEIHSFTVYEVTTEDGEIKFELDQRELSQPGIGRLGGGERVKVRFIMVDGVYHPGSLRRTY